MFQWDYWGYRSAFALLFWLPFSVWLFTRERPAKAAAHAMIWGMMWLPEGAAFDLPALPPASKYTFASVGVLIGVWWFGGSRLRAAKIGRGYDWIVVAMMLGYIGTVYTNQDALHYGTWKWIEIPAFAGYDGVSAAVRVMMQVGLPFVLGRALIRTERDLYDLLHALMIGGLIYSIPILYELRMSPVLQEKIYGFAARDDWQQNLRAGGYRATAFMGHGLVVAFFMFLSTMAAITLHKAGKRRIYGVPMGWVVAYLFGMLLLSKAAAAFIYGAVGFLLIRYLSVKAQMRVLVVLSLIVISYPTVRLTEHFPTQALLDAASLLGPDRVQSLEFRFDNEDILVAKGGERPWFGWGGFSRERVYDAETGKDIVVQDGHWIAVYGQQGLVGFIGFFGMLLLPVFQAARGMRRIRDKSQRTLLAGFGYIVAICAVNMLPNMQLPQLQFYFAAGLAVLVKELPRQARRKSEAPSAPIESNPPPAREREYQQAS
jgi:hypothetical protein